MAPRILAISLLLLAQSVSAESVTVGETYAITEQDALTELEQRVNAADWAEKMSPDKITWSALNGLRVRRAPQDRSREFVPW